jgi:hypothetical protein
MREITAEELEFHDEYSFDPTLAPDLRPAAVAKAAYVGNLCAKARNKATATKAVYKRMEAQIYIETVDHYQATGQKVTVDYIKAKISVHPDLIVAEKEYLEAEAEYQLLRAEHEALSDLSQALGGAVAYQKKMLDSGLE